MSDWPRDWKPGDPPPPGFLVSKKGTLYKKPNPPYGGPESIRSVLPLMKNIQWIVDARRKFGDRGLSDKTIRALTDCGIDFPERLLFMTEKQINSIPGVGKVSASEIKAYRERFMGETA